MGERKGVLIVGAGASGRGHMGQLADESGYHLTFLDTDRGLVDLLRSRGSYAVQLVSAQPRTVTISGYTVLHPEETEAVYQAFRKSSIIFTTVCPENVPAAADELRPHFVRWLQTEGEQGTKNVFCCENMNRSTSVFRERLSTGFPSALLPTLERRVGFPDTMIARVVARPHDPLSLLGEEYSEWTADRTAVRGTPLPEVKTLDLVDGQERYLQLKLYIHNTGHATFGYLGFLKGHTYVHEAALDPSIMEICVKAIEESGWAVEREHGFSTDVILHYRNALTEKCVLPQLPDELLRVVRDPVRKLGAQERFFGPIGLMLKHGRQPQYILYGVAAALLCVIPGDAASTALRQSMASGGVAAALKLCGAVVPPNVISSIESLLPEVKSRFGERGNLACPARPIPSS
jgi:mannitol-1-phosphate 5-dehydrogenase